MPMYEYRNERTGETREIAGRMSDPPPERVMFKASGEWMPVATLAGVEMPHRESLLTVSPPLDVWVRVYGLGLSVSVPNHAVSYDGCPASRSLPRRKVRRPDGSWVGQPDRLNGQNVIRHKDGGYTTMDGRPIIRGRADADNEKARTGMHRE